MLGLKLFVLALYTLIGAFASMPSIFNLFDKGIKEMKIKDVLVFTLFLPGALLAMGISSVIVAIIAIQESDVMYRIKKILNKKIFK